jgi:hypothetical protein
MIFRLVNTAVLLLSFLLISQAVFASFKLDGLEVPDLATALKQAKTGSVIDIGAGEFQQAGVLKKNDVHIRGVKGKTKFHSKTIQGKGLFVIKANNTIIENIECFNVKVRDANGACVRLEGKNLTLKNVYFHDSQQGILTSSKPGQVLISESKFERLGKAGRAHGIYIGGGSLVIENSQFLSSRDQGHEIKSRASSTLIKNSTIASLNGNDSRLVDIPNGGILEIYDSVLQQGPKSVNWNLIGYGLEGHRYKENRIELKGNIFILERVKGNLVLQMKKQTIKHVVEENAFIGKMKDSFNDSNFFFKSRKSAGIKPFPSLPSTVQTSN